MPKENQGEPCLEAEALVHRVDAVNRELTALVGGVLLTIDVPLDCEVVLHRERVKLRMIQSRDRVRVAFRVRADSLVAWRIEVQTVASIAVLSP